MGSDTLQLILRIVLPAVILTTLFFCFAPQFLLYRDNPVKSDAVVLFCTGDNRTREMEAERLLREGYARYLIVPARGEMYRVTAEGKMQRTTRSIRSGDLLFQLRKKVIYGEHLENTHVEALEAKRIMDGWGFRSALLVSSPYHMRRIRLIAGKVFGEKYHFACIPTPFERSFSVHSWLDTYSRGILVSEYVKLGWFMMYRLFS